MNMTNKQITTLLCSLAFVFCFADSLSAQNSYSYEFLNKPWGKNLKRWAATLDPPDSPAYSFSYGALLSSGEHTKFPQDSSTNGAFYKLMKRVTGAEEYDRMWSRTEWHTSRYHDNKDPKQKVRARLHKIKWEPGEIMFPNWTTLPPHRLSYSDIMKRYAQQKEFQKRKQPTVVVLNKALNPDAPPDLVTLEVVYLDAEAQNVVKEGFLQIRKFVIDLDSHKQNAKRIAAKQKWDRGVARAQRAESARIARAIVHLPHAAITINNALNSADAPKEISIKRLKVFGEDFVEKKVRLSGVRFATIHQHDIIRFPGIHIKTDESGITYRKDELKKWTGIMIRQHSSWVTTDLNEYCQYIMLSKERWGDFILRLKGDDEINIEGVVVGLPSSRDFGIIVTHIEKVR